MFKNKRLNAWGLALLFILSLSGCKSRFEKLRESGNTAKKYQEALRLYNKRDYTKALILFDDLVQKYRGMSESEDLSYYFAYTNYKLKDFTTARYQFKIFADTYPGSPKAEECRYMAAYCFSLDSPNYSLDQDNTLKAIEALQLFINLYPKSERVAEASKLIDSLRDKLETKSYANAKLYLTIGSSDPQNYRSAVIAFKNSLRDFPDTKYAEEMEFLIIQAQYLYAKNSLETRQEERFTEAMSLQSYFVEKYPASKYIKDAILIRKDAERGIGAAKKALAAQQTDIKQQQSKQDTTVKNN